MTTAREHREKAAEAERRAAESFERCDTDGFLTQWAHGMTAQLELAKARILEAGGVSEFTGLYEGERRVRAKLITYRCRHSFCDKSSWLLDDVEADKFGRKFIPDGPRSRIQKRLGLCERREIAPAYAFMNGRGTGLSGSAWVQIARKDPDAWGQDAEPVKENDK